MIKYLIAVIGIFLLKHTAVAQWQPSGLAGGAQVEDLLYYDSSLFMASGGVHRSDDNGGHWLTASPFRIGRRVNSLAAIGNTLFAASLDGIFRSSDKGVTWDTLTPFLASNPGNTPTQLAVIGNHLFACIGGVYQSTDLGQTWISRNGFRDTGYTSCMIAVDTELYVGTVGGFDRCIYKSTDRGATWTESPLNNGTIRQLAFHEGVLFAGSHMDGVYRSTDRGISWTNVGPEEGTASFIGSSGAFVIAHCKYNTYRSSDHGITWDTIFPPQAPFTSATIGQTLYIGSYKGWVFRSTDDGITWSKNIGSTDDEIAALRMHGSTLVAATDGSGIFRSTDGGLSWETANAGFDDRSTDRILTSFAAIGTNLFTGGSPGVYRSTDEGRNWSFTAYGTGQSLCLIGNGSDLYSGGTGDGVSYSSNLGVTWKDVSISSSDNGTRAFAVIGSNLFACTGGEGVYRSTNKGVNWTTVNTGLAKEGRALVSIGNTLVAGTLGGVFRSTNNGTSWSRAQSGMIPKDSVALSFTVSGKYVFMGTAQGACYVSANNALSWTKLGENLNSTYNSQIRSLCVSGSTLFAGLADGGIWRRSILDLAVPPVFEGGPSDDLFLEQNYPNPANGKTIIEFHVDKGAYITLRVFDVLGNEMQRLLSNEYYAAGSHRIEWDTRSLSAGSYFYSIQTKHSLLTRKLLIR